MSDGSGHLLAGILTTAAGNCFAIIVSSGDEHLALAWTVMATGWAATAALWTIGLRRALR